MTTPAPDVRALLGAYVLDAVDDVERRAVERLVAHDEEAALELAQLRAVAAELGAATAEDPPPGLRAAVLAKVAQTPQVGPTPTTRRGAPQTTSRARRPRTPLSGPAWVGVAAALALAVAIPAGLGWQQHERAVRAEARAEVLTEVLTDAGAQVLHGEVTGGGRGVAVLTDERAVLLAEGLPELTDDQVYQLWAMRDGSAVPAGLLDVHEGAAQLLAGNYQAGDGLAVSVEPSGGSERPTTDPVLVLLPS